MSQMYSALGRALTLEPWIQLGWVSLTVLSASAGWTWTKKIGPSSEGSTRICLCSRRLFKILRLPRSYGVPTRGPVAVMRVMIFIMMTARKHFSIEWTSAPWCGYLKGLLSDRAWWKLGPGSHVWRLWIGAGGIVSAEIRMGSSSCRPLVTSPVAVCLVAGCGQTPTPKHFRFHVGSWKRGR